MDPGSCSPVQRLFAPESVAVIGASPSPGKIGNVLFRNLAKFPGSLFPVHPTASEVLGKKAYPHISDIPDRVDLALLAIPAEGVPQAIADCARANVGAAVIFSGGWAETGDDGIARQKELADLAITAGLRLLGPNTSGFLSPALGLYATFVADVPQILHPGTLAIVSQSGGVN